MSTSAVKELPRWNLDDLYRSAEDPAIDVDLDSQLKAAQSFESDYQTRIAELSPVELKEALDRYEAIVCRATKISSFASLLFSTDTTDEKRGALTQKVRERSSTVSTHLLFFSLELGQQSEARFKELADAEVLAPYHHFLELQQLQARHNLTQVEETILEETANSRGRAFKRLFTEITSRMKFRAVEGDGEITISELSAYNYSPDRELRLKTSAHLAEGLQEKAHPLTFIMNTLLHEKAVMDRLRKFDSPEAERHLDNELPAAAVDAMVETVVKNYDIVAEYYKLKARLIGIDELTHVDRYAPIEQKETKIAYDQAKQIVLEAYGAFSPELRELTEPFFDENWIDVPVAEGKRGGAFCAGVTPDHHPYVLLNYTEKPRDVMTLAHELGHGVHDRLAARNHTLDYHPVLPMAETASTFGEMLVFDKLFGELETDAERLSLVCEKIEDTFATVFRQVAMYRFEQRIHRARREQGELGTETLNQLWQECQQEMFQDSLTLGEEHKWTWLYIPHIIQWPFYVYAYAFGELLVLSLYARYKEEGQSFVPKYFELLATGGSQDPRQMLEKLGIDITDSEFWQGGCNLIRSKVKQAQDLAG